MPELVDTALTPAELPARRSLRFLRSKAGLQLAALLLCSVSATTAHSQGDSKGQLEFTRQGLLIVNFGPGVGADYKLGHRAADAVRSRVAKLTNKRDTEVIEGSEISLRTMRAGYNPDTTFEIGDIRAFAEVLRADEFLWATVSNSATGTTLRGELILFRDEKLRQVLAPVTAPTLDSAATLFANAIVHARTQLTPNRRCENALRQDNGARAVEAAREGVAGYPRAVIARTCLLWAERATGASATEVLRTAREILAVDSVSVHALEAAAIALDTLHRRDEAALYWLRLAATDSTNIDLAVRVAFALFDGGNSVRAEPFIRKMTAAFPVELRLQQLQWRIAYENKSWAAAIQAAEVLLERDSVAKADSAFYLRVGLAYQAHHQPYKAIEALAHGVASFPGDSRLYSLYTQSIRAESDSVIARGLTLFPRSADLLAMSAKDQRARGNVEASLRSTKLAVAIDSSIRQGHLLIAQLELQMARPDSALFALRRGLAGGEDSSLVAQFALAEGNTLYRAASGTKELADYNNAFRFLVFADSVRSSPESKFLTGAAALAVAQSVITTAVKDTDHVAGCRMIREGVELIPVSRSGLQAGSERFAEPAKQSLDYLERLDTYAQQQVRTLCGDPRALIS